MPEERGSWENLWVLKKHKIEKGERRRECRVVSVIEEERKCWSSRGERIRLSCTRFSRRVSEGARANKEEETVRD